MNKPDFVAHLNHLLLEKLHSIQQQIDDIKLALSEDTKSTAGDKHETARSMAQLEQEKLGKQYLETKKMLDFLSVIHQHSTSEKVALGSLIQTQTEWFYLGIPLGKVQFESTAIFCVSGAAPIGARLLGAAVGDRIPHLGGEIVIEQLL